MGCTTLNTVYTERLFDGYKCSLLPPPFTPLSAMKALPYLLLFLLLLPQIRGTRTIEVKTTGKAGDWPSSKNMAANQGVANPEVKQILKQLLQTILQHRFTNKSGKGLTLRVNRDFWKLFSEMDKQRKSSKMPAWKLERVM